MTVHAEAPPDLTVVTTAEARVPATCGELLQGVDAGRPILVSLPITASGTVRVTLVREPVIAVSPDLPKARAALLSGLDRIGWNGGAVVRLAGEVPKGRGMGSSTVDVAGVITAVHAAGGAPALSPAELAREMCAIEPSDSSPLPGLWAIDHVRGSRAVALGAAPQHWWAVAVDSGIPLDTDGAHQAWGAGPTLPTGTLERLREAAAAADAAALAQLATESARRNQERLPHPSFATLRRIAARLGALGICAAHSGSLLALICDGETQAAEASAALRAEGLHHEAHRVAASGLHVTRR